MGFIFFYSNRILQLEIITVLHFRLTIYPQEPDILQVPHLEVTVVGRGRVGGFPSLPVVGDKKATDLKRPNRCELNHISRIFSSSRRVSSAQSLCTVYLFNELILMMIMIMIMIMIRIRIRITITIMILIIIIIMIIIIIIIIIVSVRDKNSHENLKILSCTYAV